MSRGLALLVSVVVFMHSGLAELVGACAILRDMTFA